MKTYGKAMKSRRVSLKFLMRGKIFMKMIKKFDKIRFRCEEFEACQILQLKCSNICVLCDQTFLTRAEE